MSLCPFPEGRAMPLGPIWVQSLQICLQPLPVDRLPPVAPNLAQPFSPPRGALRLRPAPTCTRPNCKEVRQSQTGVRPIPPTCAHALLLQTGSLTMTTCAQVLLDGTGPLTMTTFASPVPGRSAGSMMPTRAGSRLTHNSICAILFLVRRSMCAILFLIHSSTCMVFVRIRNSVCMSLSLARNTNLLGPTWLHGLLVQDVLDPSHCFQPPVRPSAT
mmetsp:Transcript_102413/g.290055  ORF Transcript_102413/g.290055 Transcript_102413/m.290055 type:complete len:216 (-) Transcript_102413:66-713(-)